MIFESLPRTRNDRFPIAIAFALSFAASLAVLLALGCRPRAAISVPAQPVRPAEVPSPARLLIATSGDYAPFSHWPPGAPSPEGFSADLARAFLASAGSPPPIDWVRFRWRELAFDLTAGRFDLALSGITVRPDRSTIGRFSLPVTTSGAVLLVESNSSFRSAADIDQAGHTIAVNAGGHLERVARDRFRAARIDAIPDNSAVLAQLERPEVRAVLSDTLEAPRWQATRPGLRPIGPLTRDRKAAWFPPGAERRVRDFDAWLLAAEAGGLLSELRERHGLPETRTATPRAALIASVDERLGLMIAVAEAKFELGREVEDPTRERRVLAAAWSAIDSESRHAGRPAPSRASVRAFYRAQIEAAKWIQREWTRQASRRPEALERDADNHPEDPSRRASGPDGRGARAAATRLEEELRPALSFLGERIARLVVAAQGSHVATEETLRLELARHALPENHLAALTRTLNDLVAGGVRRGSRARDAAVSAVAQEQAGQTAHQEG